MPMLFLTLFVAVHSHFAPWALLKKCFLRSVIEDQAIGAFPQCAVKHIAKCPACCYCSHSIRVFKRRGLFIWKNACSWRENYLSDWITRSNTKSIGWVIIHKYTKRAPWKCRSNTSSANDGMLKKVWYWSDSSDNPGIPFMPNLQKKVKLLVMAAFIVFFETYTKICRHRGSPSCQYRKITRGVNGIAVWQCRLLWWENGSCWQS